MKRLFTLFLLIIPFQTVLADPAIDTLMASMQNMMFESEKYARELKGAMEKASSIWNELQKLEQEAVRNPAIKACSKFKVLQAQYNEALRVLPPLHKGLQQSLWHVSNYKGMITKAAIATGGRSGTLTKIALNYRLLAHGARMARFAPIVGGLMLSLDLAQAAYEFGDQGLFGQTCAAAEPFEFHLTHELCENLTAQFLMDSAEFLIRFGTTGTGPGSADIKCQLMQLEQKVRACQYQGMGPFNDAPEYIYYTSDEEAAEMEPAMCPVEEDQDYYGDGQGSGGNASGQSSGGHLGDATSDDYYDDYYDWY